MENFNNTLNSIKHSISNDIYVEISNHTNIQDILSAIEDIKEELSDNNYLLLLNSLRDDFNTSESLIVEDIMFLNTIVIFDINTNRNNSLNYQNMMDQNNMMYRNININNMITENNA